MNDPVWFDSWSSLLAIAVCAVAVYPLIIVYVRIAGKRSTAKMNNFDWIVTIAIGSILAATVLQAQVTVTDGALALALLIGFQALLTFATSRWRWATRLFLSPPSVLYCRGEFDERQMRRQRVSRQEILSAVRESGHASLDDVDAVTLEPDGELSVTAASR